MSKAEICTGGVPPSFSLVVELLRISKKPGASLSTSLITTRRICRIFGGRLDAINAERRALLRQAGKLQSHLPFTAHKVDELQAQSLDHEKQQWRDLRKVLSAFGKSLILDTEGLSRGLGFDRLCDLLSVNVIERESARAEGATDVSDLIFVRALEESAARRGQDWNDAPLFNACHMAFSDFLHEAPAGLIDPFAPGAPFGPKLTPSLTVIAGGKDE